MSSILLAAGALLSLAGAAPASAANIDTTVGGINSNIYPFGAPNTATYGQTFEAGGATLTSFSLYLNGRYDGSGPLDFKAYIGTWDGSKLGTVLLTSALQTVNDSGLTEFAVSTNLAVTEGATYVAFLSISDLAAQPDSLFYMPSAVGDIAGGFVFQNNGTDFSALSTNSWDSFGGTDVFFKATFDGAVPEPATWAMMIAGFGLVGLSARRRVTAVGAQIA